MPSEEEARLLKLLQAHGEVFAQSFGPVEPAATSSLKKRKRQNDNQPVASSSKVIVNHKTDILEQSDEEWGGIDDEHIQDFVEPDEESDEDSNSDFEHTDDEFTSTPQNSNVVIFSDPSLSSTKADPVSKAEMKAFLSSKVSRVTGSSSSSSIRPKTKAEEQDDKTNAENDRLLHKLVHTKLLSGAMETELELTPAQRRKALAGRVLELTGDAKLGKGERIVRRAEKNNASKRAKNLGNYHPALKKLYESTEPQKKIKRERGMKVGVGSFKDGLLRLSRDEIHSVTGRPRGEGSRQQKGRSNPRTKPRK